MLPTVVVRPGELLAVLAIAGVMVLTVAAAGVWWLKHRLFPRLWRASRAMAGRVHQATAGGVRTGGRRLWRAVTAAEHAVTQARKVGAPTGDLDGLCRRLRKAATDTGRSLAMASR